MALPALIIGGTTALSVLMMIYDSMKSDPNVDVQGALDNLQREQLSEFERQEANKVGRAQGRLSRERKAAQGVLTDVAMLRSGGYDEELMAGVTPEPGDLMQQFAERSGIETSALRERLSPKRTGDLSSMTQDLVNRGGL